MKNREFAIETEAIGTREEQNEALQKAIHYILSKYFSEVEKNEQSSHIPTRIY